MDHHDINKKYLELLKAAMVKIAPVTYPFIPPASTEEETAAQNYYAFKISHGAEAITVESVSPGFMLYRTNFGTLADIITIETGPPIRLIAQNKPDSPMSLDEGARYIFDILLNLSSQPATHPA